MGLYHRIDWQSAVVRSAGPIGHGRRLGIVSLVGIATVVMLIVAAASGLWWWMRRGDDTTVTDPLLHTVARSDFELTVTERGEVQAFDVTEIRSLVKSKNTSGNAILRIVPEGTRVKPGDFLVELDSSALDADRMTQKISVNNAQATEVEANNVYETAVIAKREYMEGISIEDKQTIESEIFVAEENLNRAKEYYVYSQKLASKGYVNENQLEADKFAVDKAQKDLDAAKTKLSVLEQFTAEKTLKQLESDIKIAGAKWEAAKNSLALEEDKLHEIEDQIAKCTISAPKDGVVKYAHVNNGRGDQDFIVEEGAMVRERQNIVLLPNADSMQVELTVNESLIQYLRPGLPAMINPVGFGDKILRGTVQKVNQYAEPTGWRTANVKEYKARISVDDSSVDLRAGMTASVTIKCAEVNDAIQVPVQAVYSHGDKFFCFANDDGHWAAREITPGPTNDKFFVVESGLKEGEHVTLNPRKYIDEVQLPKIAPEVAQRTVPQMSPGELAGAQIPAAGAAPGPGAKPGAIAGPGGARRRGGPGGPGQRPPGQSPGGASASADEVSADTSRPAKPTAPAASTQGAGG
jgi:HlyD family secretion protein